MSDASNLTVIIETAAKVARAGMAFTGASPAQIVAFDVAIADWREAHAVGHYTTALAALNRAAEIVPAMTVNAGIYQGAVIGKTLGKMVGR